ncbi:hypothetical protein [Sphingomonas xinjiangensis]|uniref:Uncharacterized protein n=1 Tax=Sphingomonas xinjiangensis TaxID=643568 RepID=A0A840YCF9_9SPHN|nr:hypothetical protein [Sphingomonas xinjiangensis]MBB5710534.1 hypothetical protein [Sphingomonas xinjiangensis]
MRHLKLLTASAMLLGVTSVPAAQASASLLSLQGEAAVGEASSGAANGGVIIMAIGAAAIIGGAIVVASDDDDDEPDSN